MIILTIETPEFNICKYIWEQFKIYAPRFYNQYPNNSDIPLPFFPMSVYNAGDIPISDKPYFIFDKYHRLRSAKYRGFHPMKTDFMRLTINGKELETTINLTQIIFEILDRYDDSAQELNEFVGKKGLNKYYFHNIEAFQSGYAEQQSDVESISNYNPTLDLIVRYDYHIAQSIMDLKGMSASISVESGTPES